MYSYILYANNIVEKDEQSYSHTLTLHPRIFTDKKDVAYGSLKVILKPNSILYEIQLISL